MHSLCSGWSPVRRCCPGTCSPTIPRCGSADVVNDAVWTTSQDLISHEVASAQCDPAPHPRRCSISAKASRTSSAFRYHREWWGGGLDIQSWRSSWIDYYVLGWGHLSWWSWPRLFPSAGRTSTRRSQQATSPKRFPVRQSLPVLCPEIKTRRVWLQLRNQGRAPLLPRTMTRLAAGRIQNGSGAKSQVRRRRNPNQAIRRRPRYLQT